MTQQTVVSLIIGMPLYLIPAIIAWARGTYDRRQVFWLNLLIGWSGVCWILCIILAFGKTSEDVGEERRAARDLQMQWDRYYRDLARQTVYVPVPVYSGAPSPFQPSRLTIEHRRPVPALRARRAERWA